MRAFRGSQRGMRLEGNNIVTALTYINVIYWATAMMMRFVVFNYVGHIM
jgi:hypothetical protein